MIGRKLRWSLFSLWYLCWAMQPCLVSTSRVGTMFELENGVRYNCGLLVLRRARSRLQCAAECAKEKSCSGFNFGSGHCELLSAEEASCRTSESGWSHGYDPAAKYRPAQTGKQHGGDDLSPLIGIGIIIICKAISRNNLR